MKKILTIILDGFGNREESHGNAVKQAKMPNYNKFLNDYPHCFLEASGEAVGIPEGQFGNSEVGHTTIGAGRVVKQPIIECNEFFSSKKILENHRFIKLVEDALNNTKTIHLMGLASNGGIHSNISYFNYMLNFLKAKGIKKVYLHLISDGRDTSTTSFPIFLKYIKDSIKLNKIGTIASICGRYYAMDRDNKWDRTRLYYELVTKGKGLSTVDINKTVQTCYQKKITDEFLPPIVVNKDGVINNNDILIWLNFRPDRGRQILTSLSNENFQIFPSKDLSNTDIYTLLPVAKTVKSISFMEQVFVKNALGIYLSALDLTQARIAETEKYAHVTYFFDGGVEENIPKCDKFLIPSPKVATYDMQPEMSAVEVSKKVISCLEKDYDFILVNFANPDMVGHTGNLNQTIKALEIIDLCLGKIFEVAEDNFYKIILLSDHGNCDIMLDENNNPVTTHTISKVPFILSDNKVDLADGSLAQVAPTILEYMDIAIPKEMKESNTLFK